jgi:four helix bundle protein
LRVLQDAREPANLISGRTKIGLLSRKYYLVKQKRKSSLSIVRNIAEGFERGRLLNSFGFFSSLEALRRAARSIAVGE